jgi:hypothetical protein
LIEEDGTLHELAGGSRKLRNEVGHQVELTGRPGIRTSDTTLAGGASGAVEHPIFEVKSVKELAAKCKDR